MSKATTSFTTASSAALAAFFNFAAVVAASLAADAFTAAAFADLDPTTSAQRKAQSDKLRLLITTGTLQK